ncbi:histidine-type phosphatase [Sphingomonas sp. ASY06-1R]|uniref:histidine-type phosphatase n=1 Tax=Sphingomonas sp. ASY06-1R TaxID=3445771 RepID=UPI003FA30661
MRRCRTLSIGLLVLGWGASVAAAPPRARPTLVVDRVVMVMRHGIRAPLEGEVPDGTRTGAPWPQWPVAESRITPHGARALSIVAKADRAQLARDGLLPATGCPAPGAVRIRTNSSDRTIASGEAYAAGFAPGCTLPIAHRPVGVVDPLFEPLRARATAFDARTAIGAITQATGGMPALVARHRDALTLLDRVLGCAPRRESCLPDGAPALAPSADGHDLILSGPIRTASGIAQVLLLQYVEGLPAKQVGWGRADAAMVQRLGSLHAALFTVFTHTPYMAAHQAAVLGRESLRALNDPNGPRLTVLMGHDTNVTALAAALWIDLRAPGYATNDVPPDGALVLATLRDTRSGERFVRVYYRTQSPQALRRLGNAVTQTPLQIPGCAAQLCRWDRFAALLQDRLAPLVEPRPSAAPTTG